MILVVLGVVVIICCCIISCSIGGGYYMSLPKVAIKDGKSKWNCMKGTNVIREAEIWWGHTQGDAQWACNEWEKTKCAGACTAKPK